MNGFARISTLAALVICLGLGSPMGPAAAQQSAPQQTTTSLPTLPKPRLAEPAIEQMALPPPSGQKAAAAIPGAKAANADFRAALRAQVDDELALLRPRLKMVEEEAKEQADRYKEMAASKAEVGKKTAAKSEAAKARADAAAAKQGYKPKMPSAAGGKKATDAKAAGGGKAGGDKAGADKPGGDQGGTVAKKVDPVLTQQYVVLSLRDQIRHLRDRIAYLEELKARLGAKS